MNSQNTLETIKKIVSEILKVDTSLVNLESGSKNIPGWDSLSNIHIISEIEKNFGVSFSLDEILSFKKIDDIIKVIITKKQL